MSATILIVEDDPDLSDSLAESLGMHDYTTIIASSASEAIRHLKSGNPVNLIISDMIMRGGDGLALLKYVRSLNPRIPPFFLITGQSHLSSEELMSLGAQEFFVKPFDFPDLLAAIEKHLADAASYAI